MVTVISPYLLGLLTINPVIALSPPSVLVAAEFNSNASNENTFSVKLTVTSFCPGKIANNPLPCPFRTSVFSCDETIPPLVKFSDINTSFLFPALSFL